MAAVEVFADHVWLTPDVGTPPFVTGIYLRSTDDSPSTTPSDLAAAIAGAWSTDLKSRIWDGIGPGTLQLTIRGDAGETVYSTALDDATGGTQTTATGWALRCIFEAPRLFRQRNNCCYFPLPDGSNVNQEGVVNTGTKDDVSSWGTDLISNLSDTDFRWYSRHQLGGPTGDVTYAEITGAHSAATASFLRRRYR
jgi:hypothetical protein